MKAYTLQMTSSPELEVNLAFIESELEKRRDEIGGQLVVLPECFACFGGKENANFELAETLCSANTDLDSEDKTPVQVKLAYFANKFEIYLVAGTFPIVEQSAGVSKVKPMTLVYSPQGQLISQYQKIHLFDVDVNDNTGSYRESDTWQAGEEVCYFDTPWGRIGMAICYDVRFPSLFQQLTVLGCNAVVLPSAFTQATGQAHWQILIQARAIENQIFVVACNQSGSHTNQRQTFGHSMVVDPWGEILSNAYNELGLFGADMKKDVLNRVRQSMPVQQHNQFSVSLNSRIKD